MGAAMTLKENAARSAIKLSFMMNFGRGRSMMAGDSYWGFYREIKVLRKTSVSEVSSLIRSFVTDSGSVVWTCQW